MILSAGQPYFAPYPGFFEKIRASDVFVALDAVQFPRGTTWLTRNRFKNDQGPLWLTVPVLKKGLGLQRMDAVRLLPDARWRRKHVAALKSAYRRAPWFPDHLGFIESLLDGRCERLVEMNISLIARLAAHLDIPTPIVRQSTLAARKTGSALLVELCRALGAETFLVQRSAAKYLVPATFEGAGVKLSFFQPGTPVYPQLWGDFVPNLSALDLLFNCGPRSAAVLNRRHFV